MNAHLLLVRKCMNIHFQYFNTLPTHSAASSASPAAASPASLAQPSRNIGLSNSFNTLRALAAGAGFLRAWVISCRKKEEAEGVLSRRFRLNKGTETCIREFEISETLATHTTRLKLKLMNIFGENQVPTNIR